MIRSNTVQKRTLGILKYKHDISLEFAKLESWDALKTNLVMLPGNIADVSATRLQIHNPVSNKLEEAATWNADGTPHKNLNRDCEECLKQRANSDIGSSLCLGMPDTAHEGIYIEEFCLTIKYGNSLLALIQIQPRSGTNLTPEQIEIFESICPEIALALTIRLAHPFPRRMYVAGGLALLLSAYPNLTVAEQEDALINTAVDLGTNGPDDTYGYGRLELLATYNSLFPSPTETVLISPSGTYSSWDHTFRWMGLPNATYYLLEVQKSDDTLVLRKWYTAEQAGCAGGTDCSLSPAELASLASGDYKWHMRDYGAYGYGLFTPYLNFTFSQ